MSHSCEEYYDVYSEVVRKARKGHACDACERTIAKGAIYCRVSWIFEGSASSVNRCGACQKLHEHLRDLGDGETWPRETLNCGQSYENEWGEVPDDIAALAFATDDEAGSLLERKP